MTIQEESQAQIDREKHDQQLSQMKWRLEQKVKLEKQLADLVDEIAKIEVAPLPTNVYCGNYLSPAMSITTSVGTSGWGTSTI